jgi:hypothetical protein
MKFIRPKCRCGKLVQVYGKKVPDNFSKSCKSCNEKNATRQRIARLNAKLRDYYEKWGYV